MAENKNNGVKKIDDAKMNDVSGGTVITTGDPNYTYDVGAYTIATNNQTGQKFIDYGNGKGWQPLGDSTSQNVNQANQQANQYANQYGNNAGQQW